MMNQEIKLQCHFQYFRDKYDRLFLIFMLFIQCCYSQDLEILTINFLFGIYLIQDFTSNFLPRQKKLFEYFLFLLKIENNQFFSLYFKNGEILLNAVTLFQHLANCSYPPGQASVHHRYKCDNLYINLIIILKTPWQNDELYIIFDKNMDRIVKNLKLIPNWTSKFVQYNLKNHLKNNPVSRLQPQNIQSLVKHLIKLSQQNKEKHKISWVSNEYQGLQIVLNALSTTTEKTIDDFDDEEWCQISSIFPYKVPLTVKYQGLRIIMEKKQPRRRWCVEEEIFLIEIIKKLQKKNKWNEVARQLFIISDEQFFRQGKHCRERWLNHLHPSIQNNGWTQEEDIKLLSFILKKGRKWVRIAKKFDMKKSESMVKKRFYQLVVIQQPQTLPIESMKKMIKDTLQRLKSDMSSKLQENNQNPIILLKAQEKDKQFRIKKQSHNENFQVANPNITMMQPQDQLPKQGQGYGNVHSVDISLAGGTNNIMHFQGIANNNFQWIQNPYNYYFGMLNSYINPLDAPFLGYPQVIVPMQNSVVINQNSQGNPGFQNYC